MEAENTKLLYMDDSYLFQFNGAKVLKVETDENGATTIILNETIFYPQGGGQPYDLGEITSEITEQKFIVEQVRFIDGKVHHIGHFADSTKNFTEGESVTLNIDSERRILNSKLQSGGHLIDMAVIAAGYGYLKPTKGFHFPEGPNVEYEGVIADDKKESVVAEIQEKLTQMVDAGYEVQTKYAVKGELEELCYITPSNLPENKPIRIVSVWDQKYMPCGATHVKNISELAGLKITKVKCKGGSTKISYSV